MNTRIVEAESGTFSLEELCSANTFKRDENEEYIYKLDNDSSKYSGNTISKENWVRIKVANAATSTWNATNNSWDNGTTTESLDPLPPHTAYWIKGATDNSGATGGGATDGDDGATGGGDDGATGGGDDGATGGGDDGATGGGGDGTTPIPITSAMANENIAITSGQTYVVNDTITYTGDMTIENGGTLKIDGDGILNITSADTINNEAGGTINNFGTINSVDGGIDGSGIISGEVNIVIFLTNSINQINDGETYIVNDDITVANLNISSGGKLTISAGKKLKVNAVLSSSGDIINNGTIENRAINNIGTIKNNGTINTVESGISGNGNITGDGRVIIGRFDESENFIQIFTVTVVNIDGSNKFAIDDQQPADITLTSGQTYDFDVSDSSNNNHIFRFSTTQDGTHGDDGQSYTTDVNVSYNITTLTVTTDTPNPLFYYCSSHPGMGGTITIQ